MCTLRLYYEEKNILRPIPGRCLLKTQTQSDQNLLPNLPLLSNWFGHSLSRAAAGGEGWPAPTPHSPLAEQPSFPLKTSMSSSRATWLCICLNLALGGLGSWSRLSRSTGCWTIFLLNILGPFPSTIVPKLRTCVVQFEVVSGPAYCLRTASCALYAISVWAQSASVQNAIEKSCRWSSNF